MPHPGKTKFIKFSPSRAGKDVKCRGMPGGGGCLSFDLTGTLRGETRKAITRLIKRLRIELKSQLRIKLKRQQGIEVSHFYCKNIKTSAEMSINVFTIQTFVNSNKPV